MPDVLDIVVVLEHFQHTLHVLYVPFFVKLDIAVLGDHFHLGREQLVAAFGESVCHGGNVVRRGVHVEYTLVSLKIVRTGVYRSLYQWLLIKFPMLYPANIPTSVKIIIIRILNLYLMFFIKIFHLLYVLIVI